VLTLRARLRNNHDMGASNQPLGLRERKKNRTRDTIRREACRLIEQNGYANTTIDQIAEAADVAPRTFFRYFPTKESALMADDLDHVTVEALAQQPATMPSLQAFRRALEITMAKVSDSEWQFERDRQRLVFSIPELKAAQFDEYRRTVARLAEAESRRLGRRTDDREVRIFIGAVAGGLMAALDHGRGAVSLFSALDFIEAGMPLN
jgi:AcrR family transcriptional regulator